MKETSKTQESILSKTPPDDHELALSSYRIEYQPQLIEEAVLRAILGHPDERLFRVERDRIYELQDEEIREERFQEMHQRWFERLGLSAPLNDVFVRGSILKFYTSKCLLVRARSKKDVGAELYVDLKDSGIEEREKRSIVIQLTVELLTQSKQLLTFLRHELLHILDMLDTEFGYESNFPKSQMGPTYDVFLQERYRILWDITIDGRLYQNGWLPSTVRDKHLRVFKNTFPGQIKELEHMFSHFFDKWPHTHHELISFAQSPETLFASSNSELSTKGQCSLCYFPSFDLIINPPLDLPIHLINKIQKDYPAWKPADPICRQCVDLYDFR